MLMLLKKPLHTASDTLGHKSILSTNKYAHARLGQSSGMYLRV